MAADRAGCLAAALADPARGADFFAVVADLAEVAARFADFVARFFDVAADVAAARFADFATDPFWADLFAATGFAEAFLEPARFDDADFLPGAFAGGFAGALVFAFTVPPRFELALVTLIAYRGMTNKKSRGGTNR